jgi:hypothetical protein
MKVLKRMSHDNRHRDRLYPSHAFLLIRSCIVFILLVIIFGAVAITPAVAQEPDVVPLVNQARANAGLAPLVSNTQLVNASRRHSNDMAAGDFLSHTGSDGSSLATRVTQAGYSWNFVGENVLYRWNVSAQGAFDQWWNSPGHRANMMNASFCDIGVTRAQASNGRIYYTMVLARRSDVSTCPNTPPTPTPTPVPAASLNGALTLQGRNPSSGTVEVRVTIGGNSTNHNVTVTNGAFSLTGLPTGSATIRVKHGQSLAVVQVATLNAGANSVNFGMLRAGDVNNDNAVTLSDFSLLAITFNRTSGQAGYDARADLNGDSAVTLADFSLLASNFNQTGQ